ncbi:site-2 protease family protein [Oscillatoria sp. CS-180]|uniref:site-2 protease family protein n=1 Tax=Oscillatoria sp. CS-180 TaxID=3021720 RepID=UPI00232E4F6E|nr:site-2 protease family protein [Oscillatoria sp. CS-180]MDB9525988.1 site-2 protease family protein [Oscillatoria sp. CS-180]
MNGNLRAGSLFGIPFYVNVSWFLVLALITWDYGSGLAMAFPALPGTTPWLLGLVSALLLFGSVLAHELGHSFAAMQQGIGVNSITLFLFGGLAALEKESESPSGAFKVAIAGPAISLVLFLTLFTAGRVLSLSGPVGAIVSLLAYINLALGLFNLLPGLPLDGGNVLKSIVWQATGNPYKGVAFASRAGQVIGWLGIGLGAASILGISSFGSVWTLVVGWFLLSNANRSAQSATVQQRLDGLTAEDALTTNSPIVASHTSLRSFADNILLDSSGRWHKYWVVDETGQLVGTVTLDALQDVPRDRWASTPVSTVMTPQASLPTVSSDQSLLDVVKLIEEKKLPVLAVIRDNGTLLGLLEKRSIIQLLQSRSEVVRSVPAN